MNKICAITGSPYLFKSSHSSRQSPPTPPLDFSTVIRWAVSHPPKIKAPVIDPKIQKNPIKTLKSLLQSTEQPKLKTAQENKLKLYLTDPTYKKIFLEFLQHLATLQENGKNEQLLKILATYPGTANWQCCDGAKGELCAALKEFQDPFTRILSTFIEEFAIHAIKECQIRDGLETHLPLGLWIILGGNRDELSTTDSFSYPTLLKLPHALVDQLPTFIINKLQKEIDDLKHILSRSDLDAKVHANLLDLNPLAQWLCPPKPDHWPEDAPYTPSNHFLHDPPSEDNDYIPKEYTPEERLHLLNEALLLKFPNTEEMTPYSVRTLFQPGGLKTLNTLIEIIKNPEKHTPTAIHNALQIILIAIEDFPDTSIFIQKIISDALPISTIKATMNAAHPEDIRAQNLLDSIDYRIQIIKKRPLSTKLTPQVLIKQNAPIDAFITLARDSGLHSVEELLQTCNTYELSCSLTTLSQEVSTCLSTDLLEKLPERLKLIPHEDGILVQGIAPADRVALKKIAIINPELALNIAIYHIQNLEGSPLENDNFSQQELFSILLTHRPKTDELLKKLTANAASPHTRSLFFPRKILEQKDLLLLISPEKVRILYHTLKDSPLFFHHLNANELEVFLSTELCEHLKGQHALLFRSDEYNVFHIDTDPNRMEQLCVKLFQTDSYLNEEERLALLKQRIKGSTPLHSMSDTGINAIIAIIDASRNASENYKKELFMLLTNETGMSYNPLHFIKKLPHEEKRRFLQSAQKTFTQEQYQSISRTLQGSAMCTIS